MLVLMLVLMLLRLALVLLTEDVLASRDLPLADVAALDGYALRPDGTWSEWYGAEPHYPADGEGNGILGMAERVEVLGGNVQAGPRPRGGWEVVATLPAQGDGIPSADVPTPGGPQ